MSIEVTFQTMADRGTKRTLTELESDAGLDDEILSLTDTEAAITAIVNSEHGDRPCKGVLVHQLYAMLSNKTAVDTEILTLRQSRSIKLLQFYMSDTASVTESLFVMPSSAYRADLTSVLTASPASSSLHGSLTRFIPLAMKRMDKLSVLESELLAAPSGMEEKGQDMNRSKTSRLLPPSMHDKREEKGEKDGRGAPLDVLLSAADIDSIVSAGFLCRRRDLSANTGNVLWFSHPILGSLRQWIDSSRKIILVRADWPYPVCGVIPCVWCHTLSCSHSLFLYPLHFPFCK